MADNTEHGGKVAAIVGTEMRGVSPDALGEAATSLKLLIKRIEEALRTVDKARETWHMDSLAMWAPDDRGPQMELQNDVMSPDVQQVEAV